MKPPPFRLLSLAAAGLLVIAALADAAAATRPAARPSTNRPADRSVRTKERIDALLKSRLNPDPLPANLPNPFAPPTGGAIVETRENSPSDLPANPRIEPVLPTNDLPPGSDSEALARYAAGLKITGTVRLNGQPQLIINQSPYKEGDLILLNTATSTVYLQVLRITPTELTLGLNQAVLTIKLKY